MANSEGLFQPSGQLSILKHRADEPPPMIDGTPFFTLPDHPARELTVEEIIRYGCPQQGLHPLVNQWRRRNFPNLMRGAWRVLMARVLGLTHPYGQLWLTHHSFEHGDLDLGLASLRVVTTAGVNKIVAGLNASDTATFSIFKFHGIGTGTTAEASGDTALVTELTTEYATDNVRPTGSQTTGASSNVYRTVATITPDSGFPIAVTEHGIFSQAATGGGTLLDRSKFTAVSLASGDAITAQYDGTFAAGG